MPIRLRQDETGTSKGVSVMECSVEYIMACLDEILRKDSENFDLYDKKKSPLHPEATCSKELEQEAAAEIAKKGHPDAFTVVLYQNIEQDKEANVVAIQSFSVSVVGGKELLKNASLVISLGKRYGLVGPSGTGKSTLLKLLAWRKIPVPENIDIHLVEHVEVSEQNSALEEVVSANQDLVKFREQAAALEKFCDDEKLAELYDSPLRLESDVAEAHASRILAGLGFTEEMQASHSTLFKGAWRMRISLARALFLRPTLLLLDEPTKYLDLRAALWLEEYLSRWENTLLVVSDGVDFLNTVCTDILHLQDQSLHIHRGGEFAAAKAASKGKAKCKAMKGDGSTSWASIKLRGQRVVLDSPEPTQHLPPPLVQLTGVSFCYYPCCPNSFRLSNVDVGIGMGKRVAVLGHVRAGKSTLLKLVAGDVVPTDGEVRRSQELRIGWYSQHRFADQLTKGETLVQHLLRLLPDHQACSKPELVRAKLGKFGLRSCDHSTPVEKLSTEQKSRVVLASIIMSKPDILLLDEPTTHLDKETIDALADELDGFEGGVVLVSDNARLVSRFCENKEKSEFLVVKDGVVTSFQATSFEEYKEVLKREIKAEVDDLITSPVG